ncbi:MAG TPA: S8 family serine peptidase, partial [Solirubrobacteraceae bacterium]|nr:S8 family serine peptidase [Solirubrobacteraceae bacterium]
AADEPGAGANAPRWAGGHRIARHAATVLALCAATLAITSVCAPTTLSAPPAIPAPTLVARAAALTPYASNEVVVGYAPAQAADSTAAVRYARIARSAQQSAPSAPTQVLRLAPGVSVANALKRLRAERGVAWAVPDYIAHIAGASSQQGEAAPEAELIPNDEGTAHKPWGWTRLQWNFTGTFGVRAPQAWANVAADGAPGGRGVIVAVLDTGVAYATRGRWRRSPDLDRYTFVKGYDFVANNPYPYDRNGHGTFVASTIAEETNNHYGLTGLAFAARIMPVRVLNSQGEGEASTIAEGVYFAVKHHAQLINLSLEFSPGVTASDIPELIAALQYAHRHGVLVAAAAGNEGHSAIAYPARAPDVISVGATTEHGCLADYSNDGAGLTLVAPGGGGDADIPGDPNCKPEAPPGRDVYQVTFSGSSFTKFGMPSGYEGTSMATPHVTATAALIIASGVLGRHPTPAQITARLRDTARKLGGGGDERLYGAGLVDAAAATAPGGPGALARAH